MTVERDTVLLIETHDANNEDNYDEEDSSFIFSSNALSLITTANYIETNLLSC